MSDRGNTIFMIYNIKIAQSERDYDQAKELVLAYVDWLNIDLSYQQFDQELEQFQQTYGPPEGGMMLAIKKQEAVGCVAIRYLEPNVSELKRMYILDHHRGYGLGRMLLSNAIQLAKELGYHKMRLDTLPSMTSAMYLYKEAGFYPIPAYRFNPDPKTIFMELSLLD